MTGGKYQLTPEQEAARAAELAELKARLNADCDNVVRAYLPLARQAGRFWELGSPDGMAGQSLKINRDGALKGVWTWYKGTGFDRAGSMLDLVVRNGFHGDFGRAMKELRRDYHLENVTPEMTARFKAEAELRAAAAEAEQSTEELAKRDRAAALWLGAVPVAGTPAEAYLQARVPEWRRLGAWPGALRYRPDVKFCPLRGSGPARTGYPALLAAVLAGDGAIIACHGTFLDIAAPVRVHKVVRLHDREEVDEQGEVRVVRAPPFLLNPANPPPRDMVRSIKSHKATLGRYAQHGGYIPLRKGSSGKKLKDLPEGAIPHFAEGIEDALNYATNHPDAWIGASVSLANMANVWLPSQAGGICILADRDPVENTEALALFESAVAAHQTRRGDAEFVRAVWPRPGFKDFSDQAMGEMTGASA